tara:strand:- start:380 stop:532 length:153 start_codon:yes stop_codon:yes gene_type:complete
MKIVLELLTVIELLRAFLLGEFAPKDIINAGLLQPKAMEPTLKAFQVTDV